MVDQLDDLMGDLQRKKAVEIEEELLGVASRRQLCPACLRFVIPSDRPDIAQWYCPSCDKYRSAMEIELAKVNSYPAPRPSWDSYFYNIAQIVARRSTCRLDGERAAIIVRDKRIVAAGYEGAPSGYLHCNDVGHTITATYVGDTESVAPQMPIIRCDRAIHAEMNAIFQAAQFGIAIAGCEAHLTHPPCLACTCALSSVSISRIVVGGSTYAATTVQYPPEER